MNKRIKLLLECVLAFCFVLAIKTVCLAAPWEVNFGSVFSGNADIECKGSASNITKTGFVAKINTIGNAGVFGCEVKSFLYLYDYVNDNSSDDYKLSFKAKSTKVDKYICFTLLMEHDGPTEFWWVRLPKGKDVNVTKEIYRGYLEYKLGFLLGGDDGNRDAQIDYDEFAMQRYDAFDEQYRKSYITHLDLKKLDCGGDFSASTDIIISNIKLEVIKDTNKVKKKTLKTKLKLKSIKSTKKRSLLLKWKKVKGISGYQFYISRNKRFPKKKTGKIKIKKKYKRLLITKMKSKKVYYVKGRVYKKKGKKTIFGKWSKVRKVKIK